MDIIIEFALKLIISFEGHLCHFMSLSILCVFAGIDHALHLHGYIYNTRFMSEGDGCQVEND